MKIRTSIFLSGIILIAVSLAVVFAMNQDKKESFVNKEGANTDQLEKVDIIDRFKFLLMHFEANPWDDGTFSDAVLVEGLTAVYSGAIADKDATLRNQAIWAMGKTGLVEFVPILIKAIPKEPVTVAFALGSMPSNDGVYALINLLKYKDDQVRYIAGLSLSQLPYSSDMQKARQDALTALMHRLDIEEKAWVKEQVIKEIEILKKSFIK